MDPGQFQESQTWVTILLLSLLVSATLFGVALIFIYYQKLIKNYRFQQNFINGFTHELKTPIASLRLYLDTFKKYELDRLEQLKYIDFMIRDTERLTLNVNQILQIAKVEDKKFKPDLQRVNAHDFIQGFFKKNPHYFEEIAISFDSSKDQSGDIGVVSDLFEMILMNIVTNAIHYNRSSKPKLSIHFSKIEDRLEISFVDNGVGLEKKELKKVFYKMYQVGKTIKGSGLGLYLTANLVRIHKGSIKAKSDGLNKGSTFTVTLPLMESENV